MISILKDALKAQKNDVIIMISSQLSQNANIISSIISIFLPIIKCDFDPNPFDSPLPPKVDFFLKRAYNIEHFSIFLADNQVWFWSQPI